MNSTACVPLQLFVCWCLRVTQSWRWGTCWETLLIVGGNRLAPWRWSRRISWMMGHQSDCGCRLMRKRWALGISLGSLTVWSLTCKALQACIKKSGCYLVPLCDLIRKPSSPQGSAVFDFTGTGTEVWGNCNAPRAITLSALIYCLRCMVGQDIPLNQVKMFCSRSCCIVGPL